jgi:hypothetical protein
MNHDKAAPVFTAGTREPSLVQSYRDSGGRGWRHPVKQGFESAPCAPRSARFFHNRGERREGIADTNTSKIGPDLRTGMPVPSHG